MLCVEALEELSPEERQEVHEMRGPTVGVGPDGKLEAGWALNASVVRVRPRSRSAFPPTKGDLASAAASTVRFKRMFSQEQGCWSDPEMALG
jgi:hypothetical protein